VIERTCYVELVGRDIAAMLSLLQAAAVCETGLKLPIERVAGFLLLVRNLGLKYTYMLAWTSTR
jgi:hypothetical protein